MALASLMNHPIRRWAARSVELLDDLDASPDDVVASLGDIARINRVLGGAAAVVARLEEFIRQVPVGASLTLLDVGTGSGDLPRAVRARAARRDVDIRLIGLERHKVAARESARRGQLAALVAEGGTLPFASGSIDLVLCAKVLHHVPDPLRRHLLLELNRVARFAVVVADIRRSVVAAAGFWLASFPLRVHPATRRDGVISVFRGFSRAELLATCASAGLSATVRRHPGWCLTAAWRPGPL